ncbi:MAG: DnaJ domain-containing protein [Rickettsiales bacterium]|nr:DnaJ domain-containing protein [Rickettsiales bacterium]
MRLIVIGVLIVVVVHSLMTLATRVPSERLGALGQILARMGMLLGMFVPRIRMLVLYFLAILPLWRAQAHTAGQTSHPRQAMSESEAREVLNISVHATADEINDAWRQLMKKHHPDQGGTADYTRRLNEARQVLLAATQR